MAFSKIIRRARRVPRITRDAFLFMLPGDSGQGNMAQCQSCRMWVPHDYTGFSFDSCIIHGREVETGARDSCGLYVPWPTGEPEREVVTNHATEIKKGGPPSVTPEESGLVDREVRCENCTYFDDKESDCELYEKLNAALPKIFDLDKEVEEYACCNAQTPKR